jgi:hypothetical protein
MKYALFEAIKGKSNLGGWNSFLLSVEAALLKYEKPAQPFLSTVLCCLANDTILFAEIISQAEYHKVAYRVHYFQDDPVVFESHPS